MIHIMHVIITSTAEMDTPAIKNMVMAAVVGVVPSAVSPGVDGSGVDDSVVG